jgi:iron complex transport system substrate-binding protein
MRIVSLLASGTELCDALGAGAELVGRSHECDYPPWVSRLPALSRPTFEIDGSSAEVDRRVREKLRSGEPLYEVDEAGLSALEPDVVITQTHCEVCAVGPGALGGGGRGRGRRERVATFRGGTLEGVLADFLAIARVIDRREAGEALVAELRAGMAAWQRRTEALPRRRVACIEWMEPLFAMGNWGPELVALAGGESVLGGEGSHSRVVSWEELQAVDAEVLVVAPCGWGLERTRGEMGTLLGHPAHGSLRAAREGRVFIADGNRYFNRSGPGLFATVDRLAEMIHPDVFGRRAEGVDYERVGGWG